MAVLGAGSGTGFPGVIDTAQTYANISTPDPDDNTRVDAAFANDIMAALVALETSIPKFIVAGPTATRTYTFPDVNGSVPLLAVANAFTGTPTFSNATYSALFTGGNVGIGTASPTLGRLQVVNNTDVTNTYFAITKNDGGASDGVIINDDRGFSGINSGKSFRIVTRNDGLNDTGAIASFETTGGSTINALWVGINGNVGIGTAVLGTSAAGVLGVGNGTAPASSPANMIQLWAEDIAASSELRVRDEAGNVTTLSPHPTDFLDALLSDSPLPWVYRSHNDYVGQEVTVDMAGLVAEVERLSGKRFATYRAIPKRDWQDDQEAQVVSRNAEIAAATKGKDALMAESELEADATKKSEKQRQADEVKIPMPYTAKRPPVWMQHRGVGTAKELRA